MAIFGNQEGGPKKRVYLRRKSLKLQGYATLSLFLMAGGLAMN